MNNRNKNLPGIGYLMDVVNDTLHEGNNIY